MRPYVVILTGGLLPHDDPETASPVDIDLALERAGVPADDNAGRRAAGQGFLLGWKQAAQAARTVAVYLADDPADAQLLAHLLTASVDPAYVMHTSSALRVAVQAWEQETKRDEEA